MRFFKKLGIQGVLFPLVDILLVGCATSGGGKDIQVETIPQSGDVIRQNFPKVTMTHPEPANLNDTMRRLGQSAGGGVVVMHGLGEAVVPRLGYDKTPYSRVVQEIAAAVNCLVAEKPYYYFLYLPEYEALLNHGLNDRLPSRYHAMHAELSLGGYTPLFTALSLLGRTFNTTIIADDLLAEAYVGECVLPDMPLPDLLTALLASARVDPGQISVDATGDYIFIGTLNRQGPPSYQLGQVAPKDHKQLQHRVSLMLPRAVKKDAPLPAHRKPFPLKSILPSLSRQLGVTVRADEKLHDFPVQPCYMADVTIAMALDLVIRQWPLDLFGYEMKDGEILIRPR